MINKSRIPLTQIVMLGFLPNLIKKIIYRYKFNKLGKKFKIGLGSVILGEDVTIGKNVKIGFLTVIRGKQIDIADNVSIGSMTFLDCPQIKLDYGARITEQVVLGGPESKNSKFFLGKNSIVMQGCYINSVCPVNIGDDTCIGGNSLIFSHSSWLNIFDGYPLHYLPITIGNSVWVAWRVFITAGTVIDNGSVIGANSLVRGHIPSMTFAAGSPAKVISQSPNFPKKLTNEKKQKIFVDIIDEMRKHFSYYGIQSNFIRDRIEFTYTKNYIFNIRKKQIMCVEYKTISKNNISDFVYDFNLLLSLYNIPISVRKMLNDKNISWIDISNKEQSLILNELGTEVAIYLRNFGIRLLPSE